MQLLITEIDDPGYKLLCPVILTVLQDINGYLVVNDDLNVYGSGDMVSDAVQDWETSLIGCYLAYKDEPDAKLYPLAQAVKYCLLATVVEV